jgi:hypothetical protein
MMIKLKLKVPTPSRGGVPAKAPDADAERIRVTNVLSTIVDTMLTAQGAEPEGVKRGFALFVFDLESHDSSWATNLDRGDLVSAMRELISHWEAGHREVSLAVSAKRGDHA